MYRSVIGALIFTLLISITASAMSPEEARMELEKSKVPYTAEEFIKRAEKGETSTVNLFLDTAMNPNVKRNDGTTALIMAALEGHTEIVKALLAKGADVNTKGADGWTALMVAAQKGHGETVEALLAKGADVDVRRNSGATALFTAAQEGHTEIVEALLAKGADVNAKANSGATALIVAAENGHTETVEALLAKSADVNAKANDGGTALFTAAQEGHGETVEALLAKGADVNAKTNSGATASRAASVHGHIGIVQRLKQAGAIEQPPADEKMPVNTLTEGHVTLRDNDTGQLIADGKIKIIEQWGSINVFQGSVFHCAPINGLVDFKGQGTGTQTYAVLEFIPPARWKALDSNFYILTEITGSITAQTLASGAGLKTQFPLEKSITRASAVILPAGEHTLFGYKVVVPDNNGRVTFRLGKIIAHENCEVALQQ
jgi:ankyrin repeat protein